MGDRDSEIAVIVQDTDMLPGKMNGENVMKSRFALSLRLSLWREHLGLSNTHSNNHIIEDPIAPAVFHELWQNTSKRNTKIYEEIFPHIPKDSTLSLSQHNALLNAFYFPDDVGAAASVAAFSAPSVSPSSSPSTSSPVALLEQLCGHLVDLPLNFLANEDLSPAHLKLEPSIFH